MLLNLKSKHLHNHFEDRWKSVMLKMRYKHILNHHHIDHLQNVLCFDETWKFYQWKFDNLLHNDQLCYIFYKHFDLNLFLYLDSILCLCFDLYFEFVLCLDYFLCLENNLCLDCFLCHENGLCLDCFLCLENSSCLKICFLYFGFDHDLVHYVFLDFD
jgi:hypothetical protein